MASARRPCRLLQAERRALAVRRDDALAHVADEAPAAEAGGALELVHRLQQHVPVALAGQAEADVAELRILLLESGFAHGRADEPQQRAQAFERLARFVHGDGLIALVVQLALRPFDLIDGDTPATFVERLTKLEAKGHAVSAIGCTRRRNKTVQIRAGI